MKTNKKKMMAMKTEFSVSTPQAKNVFLVGDFNQWNPITHPLKREKGGIWKITLALDPGKHEYRFLIDGQWTNDLHCSSFVENPFGTKNCLRIVR